MLAVMELLDYDFESIVARTSGAEEREHVAAYLEGSRYVRAVRDACGWPGVDRLFRDPPQSRETIWKVSGRAGGEAPEPDVVCPGD
jgi:hypothetical protein